MYHTLKTKSVKSPKKVKGVKPPKGWQFSGDSSFLNLTNSNFNIFFRVVNTRIEAFAITRISTRQEELNEWKVEECHGQTGIKIQHRTQLSNKEAKELAVKLAKNLNRTKFIETLMWVIVAALLAALFSLVLPKLLD